ncbi:MAG: sigma-54-dependent Fis family transcriptional regulator, partial [Bacteroidales bacterium]|nr:sigma-54-dependent Fis family transcriptional regulator [Bacteroidales bacterium]
RERTEDIPLLVDHFINQICDSQGHPSRSFTDDAIVELQKLPWKGNIRELYNMVERLIILCDNPISGKDVIKHTTHS